MEFKMEIILIIAICALCAQFAAYFFIDDVRTKEIIISAGPVMMCALCGALILGV